jgi:hypothetical protein
MLVAQRYAGHEKGDFDDAHHHDSRIACLCHGGLLGGHASWTRQMREEVPRGNVRAAKGSTEATPGGCLGSPPALLRAVRREPSGARDCGSGGRHTAGRALCRRGRGQRAGQELQFSPVEFSGIGSSALRS